MRLNVIPLILVQVVLTVSSCSESPVGTPLPVNMLGAIDAYENVPWNLVDAFVADTAVNLTQYQPFEILLAEPYFQGWDGCNQYKAQYEILEDSIRIISAGGTLAACFRPPAFPNRILVNTWKFLPSDHSFFLLNRHSYLKFQSDFMLPVQSASFVSKVWVLYSSNDSLMLPMDTLDTHPRLVLWDTREITVWWPDSCDVTADQKRPIGYYGIGEDSTILIREYWLGACHLPDSPATWVGRFFREKLKEVNRYSMSDSTLTLISDSNDSYFAFRLVDSK
jgi:hypothetical protein